MIPAEGFCCAVDRLKTEVDAEACEKAPPTENFRSKVLRSHGSKNLPKPPGEDLVSGPQYVSYVEGSKVRCITVPVRHDPLCPFPVLSHPVESGMAGGQTECRRRANPRTERRPPGFISACPEGLHVCTFVHNLCVYFCA